MGGGKFFAKRVGGNPEKGGVQTREMRSFFSNTGKKKKKGGKEKKS